MRKLLSQTEAEAQATADLEARGGSFGAAVFAEITYPSDDGMRLRVAITDGRAHDTIDVLVMRAREWVRNAAVVEAVRLRAAAYPAGTWMQDLMAYAARSEDGLIWIEEIYLESQAA